MSHSKLYRNEQINTQIKKIVMNPWQNPNVKQKSF